VKAVGDVEGLGAVEADQFQVFRGSGQESILGPEPLPVLFRCPFDPLPFSLVRPVSRCLIPRAERAGRPRPLPSKPCRKGAPILRPGSPRVAISEKWCESALT
jgi:hypothetical protein